MRWLMRDSNDRPKNALCLSSLRKELYVRAILASNIGGLPFIVQRYGKRATDHRPQSGCMIPNPKDVA